MMLAAIHIDWVLVARLAVRGSGLGAALFVIIYACERHYTNPDTRYLSRSFLHDLAYWLYVRSDLPRLIITVGIFSLLSQPLQRLDLHLLDLLPTSLRWIVYFLTAELLAYWVHRLQHAVPFLWAFHSVHHSAEQLTFATEGRQHPLDHIINNTLPLIPLLVLGPAPKYWLPVILVLEFQIALEHSELPWRFGPLYKVFVSPAFHSFHHSVKEEHHNRNFSRLLSIFDFLFGTAVDEPERPKVYGVPGIHVPTLASQLLLPFQLIRRRYSRRGAEPTAAEAESASSVTYR